MRKHQRKIVSEVATLYRSNDPLRWVYLAARFGASRKMSDRERKILIRRMGIDIKKVVKALGTALEAVVKTVQDAVLAITKVFGDNNLHIDHMRPASELPGLAASGHLVNTRIVDGTINNLEGGHGKSSS